MIVERIWTGNAYRNFNYLVACSETGEALAIDPLDSEKTLATARSTAVVFVVVMVAPVVVAMGLGYVARTLATAG